MLTCQIPYRAVVAEPFQFFFCMGVVFMGETFCVFAFFLSTEMYTYTFG